MRSRAWNHLRAALGGYFWAPCPLCGQLFGGHEWREINGKASTIPIGPTSAEGICPDCTSAGRGYRGAR